MTHSNDNSARTVQLCQELERVDGCYPSPFNPIQKHKMMAGNPFRFLRGSASLFYLDLKTNTLSLPAPLTAQQFNTSIMGDCHVSNFGFFSEEGSHGDTIIFAPNDFDDACVGNANWDLLRFLVSLQLTYDYCQRLYRKELVTEEVDIDQIESVVSEACLNEAMHCFLASYVNTCRQLLDGDIDRHHVLRNFPKSHPLRKLEKKAKKRAAGGKQFETKSALAKLIKQSLTGPEFDLGSDKLCTIDEADKKEMIAVFRPYMDDEILDIAERLGAGTGSVNMKRYYLLVGPKPFKNDDDLPLCHVVEVKQQRVAAPAMHYAEYSPVNQLNAAHLTVVCQQRMQRRPDLVLDEVEWRGVHWLVRSRHHAKVGIKPEILGLSEQAQCVALPTYAKACAQALALAHCRGDRRSMRFEKAVVNVLPSHFSDLLSEAKCYANQMITDCALLQSQIEAE